MTLIASYIAHEFAVMAADTLMINPDGTQEFGSKILKINDVLVGIHDSLDLPNGDQRISILDEIGQTIARSSVCLELPRLILDHCNQLQEGLETGVFITFWFKGNLYSYYIDCHNNSVFNLIENKGPFNGCYAYFDGSLFLNISPSIDIISIIDRSWRDHLAYSPYGPNPNGIADKNIITMKQLLDCLHQVFMQTIDSNQPIFRKIGGSYEYVYLIR